MPLQFFIQFDFLTVIYTGLWSLTDQDNTPELETFTSSDTYIWSINVLLSEVILVGSLIIWVKL